jgi:hypothetical protein
MKKDGVATIADFDFDVIAVSPLYGIKTGTKHERRFINFGLASCRGVAAENPPTDFSRNIVRTIP